MMRLKYLPANSAYVFTFGDNINTMQIVSMGDERFFRTRAQAVAQAARQGLKVSKSGVVTPHGENPFANRAGSGMVRDGSGSFIVIVHTPSDKQSRATFHDMPHASAWGQAKLAKAPKGSVAGFFRAAPSGSSLPLEGSPWTVPFHLLFKDEYGHVVMDRITRFQDVFDAAAQKSARRRGLNLTRGRRNKSGSRNRAGGKRIPITFEIVTPESAEQGDAEERGWIDEDGEQFNSAGEAARFLISNGATEPSSSRFHKGVWYTASDYNTDWQTGAVESRSFHPKGFSEKEQRMIFDIVTGKR
jgi:hypothetical protein